MARNNKPAAPIVEENVVETSPEAAAPATSVVKEVKIEVELKHGQVACHPPGKPDNQMGISKGNYETIYKPKGWVLLAEKKT